MERVGAVLGGLRASEIPVLTELLASVTVVFPYAPAVAFMPVTIPRPPPVPVLAVSLVRSVTLARLLFAHPEKLVVELESGSAVAIAAMTSVSGTVVVLPFITPLVFAVASVPPTVTSQGLPVVVTPLIAIMRAT